MRYDTTVLNENIKRKHSRFGCWFGHTMLKLIGWKITGKFPSTSKFVLIVAPHTSNWDFIIGLYAYFALDIEMKWLGKHTIFKWPLNKPFRRWGGIPVERSSSHDVVSQVVSEFEKHDAFILALSPEGTRSYIKKWKTGFYHIAKGAEVPIQCVAFNFKDKEIQIGPLIPIEEFESDMQKIQDFYQQDMAKDEKKYNPSIY
jgi:1-acyl-sn-glycerol-3-phosphate acyltransferase